MIPLCSLVVAIVGFFMWAFVANRMTNLNIWWHGRLFALSWAAACTAISVLDVMPVSFVEPYRAIVLDWLRFYRAVGVLVLGAACYHMIGKANPDRMHECRYEPSPRCADRGPNRNSTLRTM